MCASYNGGLKSFPPHLGFISKDKFSFGYYSSKHISEVDSWINTEILDVYSRLIFDESNFIKSENAFIKSVHRFSQDIDPLSSSIRI